MRRSLALALLGLASLGSLVPLSAPARASELTDLYGPYARDADASPLAFRAGLDWRWRRRTASLLREYSCLAHETLGPSACADGSRVAFARDLAVRQFTTTLDVDLRLSLFDALEARLRLPIVLTEQQRLAFDEGVDGKSSQTAPYNADPLFPVPLESPTRQGLGDPTLGLWLAMLSTLRDPTDPMVVMGLELSLPTDSGAWGVTLAFAASSRPHPFIEPFLKVDATFRVPDSPTLYPDLGITQAHQGPPHTAGATFGLDLIPFERTSIASAVRLELAQRVDFISSGKVYGDLRDALGPTIVEEHLRFRSSLGVHYDVLASLRLTARTSLGWESPHFLTFSDLGEDLDGGGVSDAELDPDYDARVDAPGRRFRSAEALELGVDFSLTGRF